MTRKKRNKRTQASSKSNKQAVSDQLSYYELPSPFEGMSDSEAVTNLREIGETYKSQFTDAVQALQEQILTVDPIKLLAAFSYYGLTIAPGQDPELTQDSPILQHHAELLQAFVLKQRLDAFAMHAVIPTAFEATRNQVQTVSQAFARRRFAVLDPAMSLEQRRRLAAVESIRGDTQAIRNWSYPQQTIRILKDLFAPLEEAIEQTIGVRVADTIDMLLHVGHVIEERVNTHRNLLIPMARARTIRAAAEAYYRAFPTLTSTPNAFVQEMQRQRRSLDDVKGILISHSDMRLDVLYTLELDDFVRAYPQPIATEQVRALLKQWSLRFGDLHEHNTEFFFMDNPIWVRPLIHLDDDRFFWPIPQIVMSFCIELFETLIQPHADITARYEARRGKFLEDDLVRIFRATFPGALVLQGSQWHDPVTHRDYENDVLVRIGTHLLIVEAKAGKVSGPARRGAEHRLRHTIDELIVAPAIQAQRFATYLYEHPGVHRFPTRTGRTNEIDTTEVRQIVRLSVTLEPIGMLQTRAPDLRAAGLIANDVALAPTILLADLELIFELLDGMCEKLHYLIRRAQFEEHAHYLGDEMDLVAFYVDTGFNIGEMECNGTPLLLYGMSKSLDAYFMQDIYGLPVKKPQRQLTQWWRDLVHGIEKRVVPRWTELGLMLLNVDFTDQQAFERAFEGAQRLVYKRQDDGQQEIVGFVSGPTVRRDAFVGVAYKYLSGDRRNELLRTAGAEAIERAGSNQAIAIGVDVTRADYPYSVIACIYHKEEATTPQNSVASQGKAIAESG